jgi:hypothetical protein
MLIGGLHMFSACACGPTLNVSFCLLVQFLLGFTGFLYPKYSKNKREELAPWHIFLGRATFVLGLATMAVGSAVCYVSRCLSILALFFLIGMPGAIAGTLVISPWFCKHLELCSSQSSDSGKCKFSGHVCAGLQVGLQEKTQFVAAAKKLSGSALFSANVRFPAAIEIFLALTGLAVLFHHLPGTGARRDADSLLPDVLADTA